MLGKIEFTQCAQMGIAERIQFSQQVQACFCQFKQIWTNFECDVLIQCCCQGVGVLLQVA